MSARRPRLLDLFCCEGGASTGYERAGFEVYGVDIESQPLYPFAFHRGEALAVLRTFLAGGSVEFAHLDGTVERLSLSDFDAIAASPPCQLWTTMGNRKRLKHPDLIAPTRELLVQLPQPYVMENVTGARNELPSAILLRGGMFGLRVDRPRLFELSWPLLVMPYPGPVHEPVGVYGERPDGRRLWTRADGSEQRAARSVEEARDVMGMPWASWHGTTQAIPPAYTEFLGHQLIDHLKEAAA